MINYQILKANKKKPQKNIMYQISNTKYQIPVKQNGGHDEAGYEGKENNCAGQRTALAFQHAEAAVE